jgi:hypothetical protein
VAAVDARRLAEQLVAELVDKGALSVVLMGSHARGDASDASDLDLVVVGEGPDYRLDVRKGMLVSQSWASEEEHRAQLMSPRQAGSSVPGWREAVVLHDPGGAASRLQQEALDWTWERLDDRCDDWVAEQLAGFAEEVEKLAAGLDRGRASTAAVQRDLLALRLAPILAVHNRVLYGSENALWALVGERMGEEWQRAQAAAFGIGGEGFEATCAAALRLYRLATDCAASLLDDGQRAVVQHAVTRAAEWARVEGDGLQRGVDPDDTASALDLMDEPHARS